MPRCQRGPTLWRVEINVYIGLLKEEERSIYISYVSGFTIVNYLRRSKQFDRSLLFLFGDEKVVRTNFVVSLRYRLEIEKRQTLRLLGSYSCYLI